MPDEVALKVLDAFSRVKRKYAEERELEDRCFQYVNNRVDGKLGQWDSETRTDLEKVGKPTISFNEIKKFVNRLCGAQRQSKVEEKAFPRDDESDPLTAEAITDCLKYVDHINNNEMHVGRQFRDGIITGKGWQKIEWSDELDPLGEITVKHINRKRVYLLGSGEAYDLSDRNGIIEVLPMDREDVIKQWPDKESEIEGLAHSVKEDEAIPVADDYDYSFGKSVQIDEVYDKDEKKYNVLRCQKYEYREVTFLENPQTGQLKEFEAKPEELEPALQLLLEQTGIPFNPITKKMRRVKIIYVLGPVLLEEKWSPYKHNKFDLVPYFAYTDDSLQVGVVQDLLDPQDEKNKRHSQIIHILGTSARNSHWVKKGALDDIEEARKQMAKTGELIEVNGDINQVTKPIESNLSAIPAIINMDVAATQEMREISGLHDASLGQVPQGVKSGRGIQELQQPAEVIIGELFDNLLLTRKLAAEIKVSLIQQYYKSERRVRILGDFHPAVLDEKQQQMMEQGLLQIENGAKILTINKMFNGGKYNDVTRGRYDVVLDHISHNPTTRRARFFEAMNMKGMGAPIKWSTILRFSDVPGKNDMLKDVIEAEMFMQMATGAPAQALPPGGKTASPAGPVAEDEAINVAGVQQ